MAVLLGTFSLGGQIEPPDVIVNGVRDVVVDGRARECRPRQGDPLDRVNPAPFLTESSALKELVPAGPGHFTFQSNAETVTGPEFWQRTGIGLDEYVFRNPGDGRPMCIGGHMPDSGSFAGFRRIVDASPYRGKRVRFTVWVATGSAHQVHFWLAAGYKQSALYNGGTTNNRSWGGDHGWTPVLLEIGPIKKGPDHISYGMNLRGPGNAWFYKPSLDIVPDGAADPYTGEVVVIGDKVG